MGALLTWRMAILSLQKFSATVWYSMRSCRASLCDFMRKRDVMQEKQLMNKMKYEKFP